MTAATLNGIVLAERLKLTRRRGLFWTTAVILVGTALLGYAIPLFADRVDPEAFGPAGGVENFRGVMSVLAQLGAVAAILAGVTAGSGDIAAGVFRELVVTGRSRLVLFAARIPGGLLFLLPFVAGTVALAGGGAIVFAGSSPEPGIGLIVHYGAWLALVLAALFALALGIGSLLGGRVGVGVVLGWQFAVMPILEGLGDIRPYLFSTALDRLEPETAIADPSGRGALVTVVAWTLVPLAIGAWRTATRDA